MPKLLITDYFILFFSKFQLYFLSPVLILKTLKLGEKKELHFKHIFSIAETLFLSIATGERWLRLPNDNGISSRSHANPFYCNENMKWNVVKMHFSATKNNNNWRRQFHTVKKFQIVSKKSIIRKNDKFVNLNFRAKN